MPEGYIPGAPEPTVESENAHLTLRQLLAAVEELRFYGYVPVHNTNEWKPTKGGLHDRQLKRIADLEQERDRLLSTNLALVGQKRELEGSIAVLRSDLAAVRGERNQLQARIDIAEMLQAAWLEKTEWVQTEWVQKSFGIAGSHRADAILRYVRHLEGENAQLRGADRVGAPSNVRAEILQRCAEMKGEYNARRDPDGDATAQDVYRVVALVELLAKGGK